MTKPGVVRADRMEGEIVASRTRTPSKLKVCLERLTSAGSQTHPNNDCCFRTR